MVYRFCLFLFFMSLCSWVSAAPELKTQPIVDEIEIVGLWRTKDYVIRRELLFRENDILTTQDLLASIQRLKNLRIFSQVIPLLTLKPDNKVKLTLKIQEKWTTIPFSNISSGGGTHYATVGVYDNNTFGRLITTGVRYDNWNGQHGGIAWMRNPRFLGQRLLFGMDIWAITKTKQLYTSSAETQGDFTLETKKINLILKKEINATFQIGTILEIINNNLFDSTTESIIDIKTQQLLDNHNNNTTAFSTIYVEFGKLNYENYLLEGKFSQIAVKYSNKSLGSNKSTTKINWSNQIFWRLPYKGNVGLRFSTGWTNTQEIQNLYYIGGFENIRGYLSGQFRSKTYWQINTEYRIPSYRSKWIVLQHIFFVDAVGTGDKIRDLTEAKFQFMSVGTGLRIISPRVYGFNARLDIVFFTSSKSANPVSFGSQQFF